MSEIRSIHCNDFKSFVRFLDKYIDMKWSERTNWVFRGQADEHWRLIPSIDRGQTFESTRKREAHVFELITEFSRESAGNPSAPDTKLGWESKENLARHHGLPTRLLDWTYSPYVALFFAFDDPYLDGNTSTKNVAIWRLRRDFSEQIDIPQINVQEPSWHTSLRGKSQRSVLLRLHSTAQYIDSIIPEYLYKITMPTERRLYILSALDEMGINPATIYQDLDAAARTAKRRIVDMK